MLLAIALILATPPNGGECWQERPLPHVEAIGTPVAEAFRLSLAEELRESHATVV